MVWNFNIYSAHCSNWQKWWLKISILQCTLLLLAKMMTRNFNFYSAHWYYGLKWPLQISILKCTLLSLAKMMTKNFNCVHCEIEILVVILAYLSSVQCKLKFLLIINLIPTRFYKIAFPPRQGIYAWVNKSKECRFDPCVRHKFFCFVLLIILTYLLGRICPV